MAPPPPPPAAPVPGGLPRSATAVKNLESLCACCREPLSEADPVQHPHKPFMERAIELSRIGGIEKRTGGCFGAVVVRNGVVSFVFREALPLSLRPLLARPPASLVLACMGARVGERREVASRLSGRVGGRRERCVRAREREDDEKEEGSPLLLTTTPPRKSRALNPSPQIVGEGYNNVVSCNDPTW
jgi:hypothetical protein